MRKTWMILLKCFFSCFLLTQSLSSKNNAILFLYCWASYIPEDVIETFEAETGIHVDYSAYDSTEVLKTQLQLKSGYDVVCLPAWPDYQWAVEHALLLPLDPQWRERHKATVDPWILQKLDNPQGALSHGIPYLWGTTGLGYDAKRLEKSLTPLPETWGLIFDPTILRKLEGQKIYLLHSALDVLQAAMIYLKFSPISQIKSQWDQALDLLRSIRPWIGKFESSRQIENLVEGHAVLLQGYSTYIRMAIAESEGKKISYIIPKEGAMMWIDMMAIPKDAPHVKNAYRFLSFLMRPDIIARCSNAIRAANTIPESVRYLDSELKKDPHFLLPPDVLERLHKDFLPPSWLRKYLSREFYKICTNYQPPS